MYKKNKILILLSTIVSLAISVFIYGMVILSIYYGNITNDNEMIIVGSKILSAMVFQIILYYMVVVWLKNTGISLLRKIVYSLNGIIGLCFFYAEWNLYDSQSSNNAQGTPLILSFFGIRLNYGKYGKNLGSWASWLALILFIAMLAFIFLFARFTK